MMRSPAVQKLRELMKDPLKFIVCPGVYDGISARIALKAGFDCLYMTGAGTTMSRLGMPDLGVATLNDMRDHAAMIASLDRSVPLVADMDTGYGGPLMVGRSVDQYIQAGVAGFHIEDQIAAKRCGHLMGKEVVAEDVWYSRIRAAVNARTRAGCDIVIIARTDALQPLGYNAALARLKGALDIGADVAFLEGIQTKEQAQKACEELAPHPVMLNMVQGGVTPHFTAQEAAEHGFKFVIYPSLALAAVHTSITQAYEHLKSAGDVVHIKRNPKEMLLICGLKEAMEFDIAAGGKLYENGV